MRDVHSLRHISNPIIFLGVGGHPHNNMIDHPHPIVASGARRAGVAQW